MCDDVLMISSGSVIACDTIENLKKSIQSADASDTSLEAIYIELLKKNDRLASDAEEGAAEEEVIS